MRGSNVFTPVIGFSAARLSEAGPPVDLGIDRLGRALQSTGMRLLNARRATEFNDASIKIERELAGLDNEFARDTGYTDRTQRYTARAEEIYQTVTEGISDGHTQGRLRNRFDQRLTNKQSQQNRQSLELERDHVVANLETGLSDLAVNASRSSNAADRAQIYESARTTINEAVQGGWVQADVAARRLRQFEGEADGVAATQLIEDNPAVAVDLLEDPQNFGGLTPAARVRLQARARNGMEREASAYVTAAIEANPVLAAAALGVPVQGDGAKLVFDALIQAESSGNANAVGPSNHTGERAIGIAQLLPSTARMMARSLGLTDIVALNNTDFKQALRNPDLNRRLGEEYLRQMLSRYDGNLAVALSGYNAGPRFTDFYLKETIERFGTDFTTSEFVSVVHSVQSRVRAGRGQSATSETANYINKILGDVGGLETAHGRLDRAGQIMARTRAGNELQSRAGARDRAWEKYLRTLTQELRPQLDDVTELLAAGSRVSAQTIEGLRGGLELARDETGLARLEDAEDLFNFQQDARTWRLEDLEQYVTNSRELLATDGLADRQSLDRLKVADGLLKTMTGVVENDGPLIAASRAGLVDLEPVDLTLGDGGASINARIMAGEKAAAHYNAPPSFLTPDEVRSASRLFAGDDPVKASEALIALSNAFGDQSSRVFQQIEGASAFDAYLGGLAATSEAHHQTILLAKLGQRALAEKAVALPRTADMTAVEADLIGVAYRPAFAGTRGQVVQVARAIYAGEAVGRGLTPDTFDRDLYERSLRRATGGVLDRAGTWRGGLMTYTPSGGGETEIIAPPGFAEGAMEQVISRLGEARIKDMSIGGGLPITADGKPYPVDRMDELYPVPAGHGRYRFSMTNPADGVLDFLAGSGASGYFELDLIGVSETEASAPPATGDNQLDGPQP